MSRLQQRPEDKSDPEELNSSVNTKYTPPGMKLFNSSITQYLSAAILVLFVSMICFVNQQYIGYQVVSLFFLFIISVLPILNFSVGPMLLAALLSAFILEFLFIPPPFTFHILKAEDVLMFFIYFIVALVSGLLSSKIISQQKFLRLKEERTAALYNFTKDLSAAKSIDEITEIAVNQFDLTFNMQIAIYFSEDDKINSRPHSLSGFYPGESESEIVQICFDTRQPAGKFTNNFPGARASYWPLISKSGTHGVIAVKYTNNSRPTTDQEILFDSFLAQLTNALEREYLNELAKKTLLATESEKLYKTLFNSISHELKTPITTIISVATSFADDDISGNYELRKNLSNEIGIASERLKTLVENLLDMTRLESGNVKIKLDWNDIDDLINNCIQRLKYELDPSDISARVNLDINPFRFDLGLMEQALVNILHNCIVYSGEKVKIFINVTRENDLCRIEVKDNGPGFPESKLNKLFEKFYRLPGSKPGGIGLGLSISKGFIEAHKGTICAENSDSGGALFIIKIPILT